MNEMPSVENTVKAQFDKIFTKTDAHLSKQSADSCSLGYPQGEGIACGCCHGLSTRSGKMGRDVAKEANMNTKATKKLVREGDLVAEVEVTLLEAEGGWPPICLGTTPTNSTTCGTRSGPETSSEPPNLPAESTGSHPLPPEH
jgi:hypothetical protein